MAGGPTGSRAGASAGLRRLGAGDRPFRLRRVALLYDFLYTRWGVGAAVARDRPRRVSRAAVADLLSWASLPLLSKAVVVRGTDAGQGIGGPLRLEHPGRGRRSTDLGLRPGALLGLPAAIALRGVGERRLRGGGPRPRAADPRARDAARGTWRPRAREPSAGGLPLAAGPASTPLGFIAPSLEIVWFRVLGVASSPTRSPSGSCSPSTWRPRGRAVAGGACAPASRAPVAAFFALQAAIVAYAPLSLRSSSRPWAHGCSSPCGSTWPHLGAEAPAQIPLTLFTSRPPGRRRTPFAPGRPLPEPDAGLPGWLVLVRRC